MRYLKIAGKTILIFALAGLLSIIVSQATGDISLAQAAFPLGVFIGIAADVIDRERKGVHSVDGAQAHQIFEMMYVYLSSSPTPCQVSLVYEQVPGLYDTRVWKVLYTDSDGRKGELNNLGDYHRYLQESVL